MLRHQQKLHLTAPPSSRRRRESASSASGSTRVRKNSIASNAPGASNGTMRPRANTISHVDNSRLSSLGHVNPSLYRPELNNGLAHASMYGLPGVDNHHYRGMSSALGHHGNLHVLPKLETRGHDIGLGPTTLRTAPPRGGFGSDGHNDGSFFGHGSTINPAQLHFSNSPLGFGYDSPASPFHQAYSGFYHHSSADGEAWYSSFDQQMSFDEQAIENSSPSAIDSASPAPMSEMMIDSTNNGSVSGDWQPSFMNHTPFGHGLPLEGSHQVTDFQAGGPLSPKSNTFHAHDSDLMFTTPPPPSHPPHSILASQPFYPTEMTMKPDTPSNSAASISSSNRQSSVTSVSTDSITDSTRQALINSLTENVAHGSRRKSTQCRQPQSATVNGKQVPSTQDLQRYVAAYIKYFHPHLPFLHVATLQFDAPAFTCDLSSAESDGLNTNVAGGGGCLILAMAAIGALYEYDFDAANDLADMAKVMIQLYLQERRKADTANAVEANSHGTEMDSQNTPLWLVQAMLLNVIYGHNRGDKTAAGIANTHCAALVSLARGAGLVRPNHFDEGSQTYPSLDPTNLAMRSDEASAFNGYLSHSSIELEKEWRLWKIAEERKRTLYAIFILSSLLVSAYNSSPALMNSEILLDLPCDERLWSADSAETFHCLGGVMAASQNVTSFASALSSLLSASGRDRHQRRMSRPFDSAGIQLESLPEVDLHPSTFGCLVLINALHNYIWETRQHHIGRTWSQTDTERLHGHIEPALRAWQAAWSSNPDHSLERPNPFGATSLSADCIPLLDLAYVRLFVNLGKSKELFFQREYDAMAEELASGSEIVQHAEHSDESPIMEEMSPTSSLDDEAGFVKVEHMSSSAPNGTPATAHCSMRCSRRERHLRKAAYCAANSLMMCDRLNVTFADFNSRELPLQSALCAFDCAQILAEWVSTVQQRTGSCGWILGQDDVDLTDGQLRFVLEEDDLKLMDKIKEILASAELKLASKTSFESKPTMTEVEAVELESSGYGCKILSLHARMFEREAVWPGKSIGFVAVYVLLTCYQSVARCRRP